MIIIIIKCINACEFTLLRDSLKKSIDKMIDTDRQGAQSCRADQSDRWVEGWLGRYEDGWMGRYED